MAANTVPIWPSSPMVGKALCTAAKTTYGDNANLVEITRGDGTSFFGANGGLLKSLTARALATNSAMQVQLFSCKNPTAGTPTYEFVGDAVLQANTVPPAAGSKAIPADFGFTEALARRGAPGEKIYAGISAALAGGVVFDAQGDVF